MWLFLQESFLSVVAHNKQPENLLVRSRIRGDIERAIPTAEVFEDLNADYRFRCIVAREVFAKALADAAMGIDYNNFKSSVRNPARHDAYMSVWGAMANHFGAYGSTGSSGPKMVSVDKLLEGTGEDPHIRAFLHDDFSGLGLDNEDDAE
jgi:hypothetical protein